MSEEKVKFVERKPDPEWERINGETMNILRPGGRELLRRFFD
jgi:hypothetical protein